MHIDSFAIFITEFIGTIAFAISGALVATDKKMDLFGVVFIGCTTAVGGGMIRDLVSGSFPPAIFANLYILVVAILSSLAVFIIAYIMKNRFFVMRKKIDAINNVFDAVGLGAFSVIGTEKAFQMSIEENALLAIFMGMITCVGGGILRDVLVDSAPYIFKKRIYAIAAITGSAVYYFMRFDCGTSYASFVAMGSVVAIRLLATKYKWELPRIGNDE